MQTHSLPPSWNLAQIFNDLDQSGYALIDDAYPQDYVQALVAECTAHLNEFRNAAIQNGVVSQIRSDHILWLDSSLPVAEQHTQTLMALAEQLNRAFFWALRKSKPILPVITPANFMPCTAIIRKVKMAG